MKSYPIKSVLLAICLALLMIPQLGGQDNTNQRAQWFTDARFGMFIHWGIYSGAEGMWKGEKIRHANNYAEWIYYRNRIDRDEYLGLLDKFNWDEINPEEWVILAKNAGMKYVTITAKHHDGFGLWDSKVSAYDIGDYTNPKRDIIKELADACKKHNMKLGLYYSHWVDWEHKFGWDHTREIYNITPEEYDVYWQEKVIPQMKELLSNYGDVGIIWFDMWIHHSRTIVSKDQLMQLKDLIRELQPNCLVNSRLGLSIIEDSDVDFRTLGDNQTGNSKLNYPWQSPATVAHSWGYHADDNEWKSATSMLKILINNVSLNGNYMLNIGPRANGEVPYEIEQRLNDMGSWLQRNGESIYNAGAYDLLKDQHDWGKITYKETDKGKHRLYLHIYRWPLSNNLPLTGISNKPVKAFILSNKEKTPLDFTHSGLITEISIQDKSPDPLIPVIVLEYNEYPQSVTGIIARSVEGGTNLNHNNARDATGEDEVHAYTEYGTVPPHVSIKDKYRATWTIYIDNPGVYTVDCSYSSQSKSEKGEIKVGWGEENIAHNVRESGLTVGEPNQKWHIPNFKSHRIGEFNFTKPGLYNIEIEVRGPDKEVVKFQWLWIDEK